MTCNGVDLPADAEEHSVATLLGRAGFRTAIIGKAHFATTYPFFHKKGYNVLYIDGHARWVGTEGILRWEKTSKQNYQAAALSAFNEAGG